MELTPASRTRSRKARSLNIAFTSAWQSSKVPSMATACTLGSAAVVIMRRCTSEMRPCGKSTTASTRSEPRKASIAAPPVSPEVAPTMVTRSPRVRQHAVHQAREQLHGHVLEGQRRPVEQLQHPEAAVDLHQRRDGRVAEAGVGVAGERDQLAARDGAAGEGLQQRRGNLGERLAGEAGDRLGGQLRPGLAARTARRRAPARPAGRPRRTSSGASPLVLTYRKGEGLSLGIRVGPGSRLAP